ncbi:MAG: acyl-CoA thioester hydrolase [Enterobacterales bacterium]|jgi:acyl-CoA thioester hydrolase
MFSYSVIPGFSDTDALGHINNTRLPVWFENARTPIFKLFTPDLDLKRWPLILARITVDFKEQMYLDRLVEIKSYISKIGNASFITTQEAWQDGKCTAKGEATMVHFDYHLNKSVVIPADIRSVLEQHLLVSAASVSSTKG